MKKLFNEISDFFYTLWDYIKVFLFWGVIIGGSLAGICGSTALIVYIVKLIWKA